ncbi:acyl-CoA thioesterase [Sphingomonas nostoxanthinifaciens]|uniref:acyl-CoA thioesterase n=1 Tax=Sphingomonas nostoxanthinifaciens TaxID=2872652 RepID=UPI001CC208F0|nr:acyl-CoA thioesterase [Sphingomonas nostoxanthinifaciens]UAK26442.1 acyl-CoA thioesterase [Sphingomonas nostoxanthinifaciens]
MPADTNPYGDIFGGWLLSQMDSAAGTVAAQYSGGRAVTIAIDGMTFHRPVKVGDVVSVYAEVVSTGRSSMKIEVAAWRRVRAGTESDRVTHAHFTFVAIGEDGRPRPIVP